MVEKVVVEMDEIVRPVTPDTSGWDSTIRATGRSRGN